MPDLMVSQRSGGYGELLGTTPPPLAQLQQIWAGGQRQNFAVGRHTVLPPTPYIPSMHPCTQRWGKGRAVGERSLMPHTTNAPHAFTCTHPCAMCSPCMHPCAPCIYAPYAPHARTQLSTGPCACACVPCSLQPPLPLWTGQGGWPLRRTSLHIIGQLSMGQLCYGFTCHLP